MRTREIVNLGGGQFGFIEGDMTYGGFGAFHGNTHDFGITDTKGLIGMTSESVQPFLNAAGYVAMCWLFLYFLYKKKVFLKV